jgi:hypothetical protein
MSLEEMLRMAREAGWTKVGRGMEYPVLIDRLQRFTSAVLAWADVNSLHTCHAECDRPGCVGVREAVAAEREACIEILLTRIEIDRIGVAAAIRARGEA